MADTKQISATINTNVADTISKIAKAEKRSFSAMVEIILAHGLVKFTAFKQSSKK